MSVILVRDQYEENYIHGVIEVENADYELIEKIKGVIAKIKKSENYYTFELLKNELSKVGLQLNDNDVWEVLF